MTIAVAAYAVTVLDPHAFEVKHHAAIIDPVGAGGLRHAIDGFDGRPTTKWALRLAPDGAHST